MTFTTYFVCGGVIVILSGVWYAWKGEFRFVKSNGQIRRVTRKDDPLEFWSWCVSAVALGAMTIWWGLAVLK